jgi:hypothetical protein
MDKSAIVVGKEYAIRERRIPGSPFQRVKLIEHIRRNKWKAKWIDPNPGLVDYVESAQIIVLWKEQKAFLRDEEDAARLAERSDREGFKPGSPIAEAMQQVFESMGENIAFYGHRASGEPEAFSRVRARAHDPDNSDPPGAYTDRLGTLHWSFQAALDLARKFCAAEPSTVLVDIEATEREWSSKASRPGEEYIVPLLNQYRASWAIIRQWTGHDPAIAEREAYIERLQRLVWDTVYALQKAGLDNEAAKLRRLLERR